MVCFKVGLGALLFQFLLATSLWCPCGVSFFGRPCGVTSQMLRALYQPSMHVRLWSLLKPSYLLSLALFQGGLRRLSLSAITGYLLSLGGWFRKVGLGAFLFRLLGRCLSTDLSL